MLASYSRLRSSSNPPRPRSLTVDTTAANQDHRDGQRRTNPPTPDKPKFKVKPLAGLAFAMPSHLPRKLRLKRPGSSSSSISLLPKSPSAIFDHTPSPTPPRPIRNPARPRPTSSSGVPRGMDSEKQQLITQSPLSPLPPVHFVEIPLEGAQSGAVPFPMSAPADVALQRKRSRWRTQSTVTRTTGTSKSETKSPGPQFSTADRTILEELKSKMNARDSQFRLRSGKKHHIYSASEVPYPVNYQRDVLDNDIWETKWMQQVCGSVTWHIFSEPPARVLDIGCGVGTWILDSARVWKNTHFVGLDIVPIQPDLQQVGSSQLASRVTWVQANFLEGLPFQDEEFDYVHIKRIARGVPEDKWDMLLEEISRVMKPGAAIEIIEEDLYLPGGLRARRHPSPPLTSNRPPIIERPRAPTPISSSRPLSADAGDPPKMKLIERRPMAQRRNTEPVSFFPVPVAAEEVILYPSPAVVTNSSKPIKAKEKFKPPVNPRDHSVLDYIYTEMHSVRFVNMVPLSLLANSLSMHFKNLRTHAPLIASFPPRPLHLPQSPTSPLTPSYDSETDSSETGSGSNAYNGSLSRRSSSRHANAHHAFEASVSVEGLVSHSNPFVTLDESRFNALSPSSPVLSRQPSSASRTIKRVPSHLNDDTSSAPIAEKRVKLLPNKLPNTKLDFDVGSLNLHLSLRVHEVLACSETMWDYVEDYQRRHRHPPQHPKVPPHSPSTQKKPPDRLAEPAPEPIHAALMGMTRWKFNTMLEWFELDMRDNISLGPAVQTQLGWGTPVRTPGGCEKSCRHEFEKACREWERYQADPAAYFAALEVAGPESDSGTDEDPLGVLQYQHHPHPHNHNQNRNRNHVNDTLRPNISLQRKPSGASSSGVGKGKRDREEWEPEVPPSERLSRTMRVLVAWKA